MNNSTRQVIQQAIERAKSSLTEVNADINQYNERINDCYENQEQIIKRIAELEASLNA